MERLTVRNSMGVAVYKQPYECDKCNETIWRLPDYGNGSPTDRLAKYEELEEQCIKETTWGFKELLHKWKIFLEDMADLVKYRQLEEQGLILRLPCKVDDMVWITDFGKLCAYRITGYSFGVAEDYINEPISETELVFYYENLSMAGSFAMSAIGKSVFLTKEEADQALKQMGE